ncbi:MAG TPA: sigma-54 dependent transcriptional regulator [Gammaproteobacteria bacterium]|nr:sigma-54 dependent transcriptional regulator [Gammaproteobacteria bacterium]
MSKPVALIVDDEPDIRELLAMTLARMGIDSVPAADLAAAKHELNAQSFDLCLTDKRLPDGDGLGLVGWMQTRFPATPVAVITAHGNVEAAVEALKAGAFDFVSKPVELEQLRKLIATALKLRRGAGDGAPATRLLGESPAIEAMRAMIGKVARSQAPVHITGESGTGKELVARLIHESGPRAAKPFVPINCGAIPSELMESEFFGHRKGSFTGAVADKTGLVQSAEGGTLFLDEVADLPLPMQVKLLRVIQEKRVRPVGAPAEIPVDVRILSATHRNLRELIAAGQFREDLYYRIDVIEVHAPTLRERPEDIALLARHIIARLAANMDMPPPNFSPEAMAMLEAYDYPGNVRELENILERALALCDGDTIVPGCIALRSAARGNAAPGPETEQPLERRLGDVEREAIVEALEATRYNKTAAARRLGMTFRQLRYRIKKLDLDN